MKKIAALYTCHNRKNKTLKSVQTLYKACQASRTEIYLDVYVTDDGSTDGTSEALKKLFPEINLIQGDGKLFWAEGMRSSWSAALNKGYEAYLLLNDDVELYEGFFTELIKTHNYCLETYGKSGIYIGATEDRAKQHLTYSGSLILNKFLYTQKRLTPNGYIQECDLANANIMLVDAVVVEKIGILPNGYSHGIADYDYTITARRNKIPVLVAPEYCGHCENDHKDIYSGFADKPFRERKRILFSPTGLAYKSYLRYMKKFFPLRYPIVVLAGMLKLYFPGIYLTIFNRNRSF